MKYPHIRHLLYQSMAMRHHVNVEPKIVVTTEEQ